MAGAWLRRYLNPILHLTLLAFAAVVAQAAEFHVATNGADSNPGTKRAPLRTIQRAAELAQPGDTVTVHAGIYRERVHGAIDTRIVNNHIYHANLAIWLDWISQGTQVLGNLLHRNDYDLYRNR